MIKELRTKVVYKLWDKYQCLTPQLQIIQKHLSQKGLSNLPLDHFAVIDLPGPHSGIPFLKKIFTDLGYVERGKDYLADKQNDFLWMAENDCDLQLAKAALPQVVVADFRLNEMPLAIQQIILKYSSQSALPPTLELNQPENALSQVINYLSGRDWPLPTVKEYLTVREFNELLAWVLVFGRRPNHFTLSIHLCDQFKSLNDFNHYIEQDLKIKLNEEGGIVKGSHQSGISQSSTTGEQQTVKLADGSVNIPTGFVEFVWRFSQKPVQKFWNDYFTGFVAQHADNVIESLYLKVSAKH